MERAKPANGKEQMSSVRNASERAQKNREHAAGPEGAKSVRKKPTEKLVCRYCGSNDLAPSFIKRRDRRCRKCFSKRYGSAARVKNASRK